MVKQVQEAYIVAATRTPVGKAPRGMMRHVRPDDMLAHVISGALAQVPTLDPLQTLSALLAHRFSVRQKTKPEAHSPPAGIGAARRQAAAQGLSLGSTPG